jgi:8-oxo-dGTP diphosphatase
MSMGAKAIVVYNGKILMFLRDNKPIIPYPNMWDLPGGAKEEGETLEETAKRELFEEAGVKSHKVYNLGIEKFGERVGGRFLILLDEEEMKDIHLGDEGQEYRFFTLDEALQLDAVPHLQQFIDRNKELLKDIIENGAKVEEEKFSLVQQD